MLAAALVAGLLHSGNLLYVGEVLGCNWSFARCSEGELLLNPDSRGYVEVSAEIGEKGLLGASYLHRGPGYPVLIGVARCLTGSELGVLWLSPLLAACAGAALVWLAWMFTGSMGAGIAAGLLFCVWPAAYQFETTLATDAVHGMLVPVAVALSLGWARTERTALLIAAMVVWAGAQAIRPTFFVLVALWPILLLQSGASARFRKIGMAAWACTLIVPVLIVASNQRHHGLAVVSDVGAETLSAYAVPRLKEELGLGDFRALREEAWERYRPLDLETRIDRQRSESWRFLRAHPVSAALSFAREIGGQLLAAPRPSHSLVLARAYPRWMWVPRWVMPVFWFLAAAGIIAIARRHPVAALFQVALFLLVMLPAAVSHFVEGRLRFPLDLLAIPLLIAALHEGVRTLRDYRARGGLE